MRFRPLVILLLVSISSSNTQAEERPPLVVPPGAEITLSPFKQKWLLGENILLYYEVKNTGSEVIEIDFGGDYRGGTRAGRFKVLAFDEAGELQADPASFQRQMGGLGGTSKVEPGESWFGNVALMSYRNLSHPGKYTIRVAHDMGWGGEFLTSDGPEKDAPSDPRWAETTIEVAMPTEEEAKAILVELLEAKDPGWSAGKKRDPYPAFDGLRYPVYVPLLLKLSRAHHLEGVWALGEQYTPESTSALLELLFLADDAGTRHENDELLKQRHVGYVDENETVAEAAARYLSFRIPDPLLEAGDKQAYGWDENYRKMKLKRITDSWRPEHAESVRKYARDVLLNRPTWGLRQDNKERAVMMLQGIATEEDHPVIVKALDDALRVSFRVFDKFPESIEAKESPLHYGILFTLQRCVKALKIHPKTNPESPGEIAVYLEALRQPEGKIPPEFEKLGVKWLRHSISYVRRLTVEALPRPIPDWAKPELPKLLSASYVGLRYETARAIKDSADPQFREVVLERIAVEKDDWVMAELDYAAKEIGVPRDILMEAWARRLGEDVYDRIHQRFMSGHKSFDLLASNAFEFTGSGSSAPADGRGSKALSKRWLAFINNHREEILAGRKYRIGDPEMTEDLFPAGTTISYEDKTFPSKRMK